MVYKIIQTKWNVFIESLVLTLLIFVIGFSVGLYFEYSRTNSIIQDSKNYEIQALDLKLQDYYYQIMDRSSCTSALAQNFKFADDLYTQGLNLEKFEEANQITADLRVEKKKYVLLKTELWLNSLILKQKCNNTFDTVVYFYSGDPAGSDKVAEQLIMSNILKTVKEDKGNKIILLPIAGDLDLQAVDLQMKLYNVSYLPSVVINEKTVLRGFHNTGEIESYLRN